MIAFIFFLKGFSSLSAQVLLLREFFIILAGNELSAGGFFAIWVLSGAAGSFLARYLKKQTPLIFLILIILEIFWLFVGLFFIRSYRNLFNLYPGQMIGIFQSFILIFLSAGVFNFFQGIRFVLGSVLLKKGVFESKPIGFFYGWEAAGALGGGIFFAFFLQKYTQPFQTAAFISLISIISFLPLLFKQKNSSFSVLWSVVFCLLVFFFFFPQQGLYSKFNELTLMRQWGLKKPPLYYVNTHYGNITVFEENNQISIMTDGSLFVSVPYPDFEWIETMSHLPLLYSAKTDNILVIGAGAKGVLPEIQKYSVKSIDCIEINPEIFETIKKFSPSFFPDDRKINIIQDDAFRFLKKITKKWDVIILDAGFPFSLKIARFYTAEFFDLVKRCLTEDGIFYLGIEGSPEYMCLPLTQVHSTIYETLKNIFPQVQVIPGYLVGYCATKKQDVTELSSRLLISKKKEKGIFTKVMTDFYLDDRLSEEKNKHFISMLASVKKMKNTFNRPIIIKPAIEYWIFLSIGELKNIKKILINCLIAFFAVAFLFFFSLFNRENRKTRILELTVFSTGFLCLAWELVFLFLFQVYYGSLYFYLSVLTGFFMGGMTAGSIVFSGLFSEKQKNYQRILFCWQTVHILFGVLSLIFIVFLSKKAFVSVEIFFIMMAVAGFLGGWEFPLVNQIYISEKKLFSDSISRFYSVDLLGTTAGSLLTSTILVPLLGIIFSCLLFIFFKTFVALLVLAICKD